ncbi:MAG TPA: DUF4185 domain-containing protein [Verrucomicrobiae bacterium]|nr:DUF4185 domain-containing protein [Verrucomicrobiae bacterium]
MLFVLSAAAQPSFVEGRAAPEMDALFQQANGWVGGDGAFSVALTPERTLWLFSDTWIGEVHDGKRTNVRMVNNTLGLQDGRGAKSKLQFVVRRNAEGRAVAFLTPEDKHGWFWLQAGACVDQQLFMFLAQIETTGAGGAFGFRQVGQSLGIVTNPLAPPLEWRVEQHKLPCVEFTPGRHRTFGAATLVDGGYVYIYGTDEGVRHGTLERYLTVARAPTNRVADFSAWRYYASGQWSADYREATRLVGGMASECSVSFLPKLGKYVLVYTDQGLSPKILARTSRTPWGDWSEPVTIYRCTEMSDKGVFCYAAKAHPSQGADDVLMISYVANAYEVGQVIADASLYWPRFVRVPLAAGSGGITK